MRTKKFREYNLDQQFLFPPDIRDWVPEDDFARFISDLVDTLELKGFEEYHKPGAGQPPYDPAMMLKVILYCFCTGVFSTRKMERASLLKNFDGFARTGLVTLRITKHGNFAKSSSP